MAFHFTSQEVVLEGTHTIKALCRDRDGEWHTARIDLDRCLGNSDGKFQWGGVNFSRSARQVRLVSPFLFAELRDTRGQWKESEADLTERIENVNGRLRYTSGGASAADDLVDGFSRLFLAPIESAVSALIYPHEEQESHTASAGSRPPVPSDARERSATLQPEVEQQSPHPTKHDSEVPQVEVLSASELGKEMRDFLFRQPASISSEFDERGNAVLHFVADGKRRTVRLTDRHDAEEPVGQKGITIFDAEAIDGANLESSALSGGHKTTGNTESSSSPELTAMEPSPFEVAPKEQHVIGGVDAGVSASKMPKADRKESSVEKNSNPPEFAAKRPQPPKTAEALTVPKSSDQRVELNDADHDDWVLTD